MTQQQYAKIAGEMKEALGQVRVILRPLARRLVQELLEAQMNECLGAV